MLPSDRADLDPCLGHGLLGGGDGVLVEVEDGRGQDGIGPARSNGATIPAATAVVHSVELNGL